VTVYDLKPRFQRLLRPLAAFLVRHGVRPNTVSWLGLALSLAMGALLAWFPRSTWVLLAVPVVLLVRMALNAVDGVMAARHDLASPLGTMLNELADVASDAVLYLPFAWVTGSVLVVPVVVAAALTEVAGILGPMVGASRRYDGPAGKSDRAVAFGGVALVLAFWTPPPLVIEGFFGLLLALLAWTVVHRVRGALREVAS
jgi:CDP-diacylglycerol--glycerol-3-phosphate 3-phosphatidyltransferase